MNDDLIAELFANLATMQWVGICSVIAMLGVGIVCIIK